MATDSALDEIVSRLVKAYEPQRIYLFGSQARGESDAESDYDLMVVVPDGAPPDKTGSRLAYECLWGTAAATDVLVWRKSDFEDRLHLKASLPATVVREGRLLYAA